MSPAGLSQGPLKLQVCKLEWLESGTVGLGRWKKLHGGIPCHSIVPYHECWRHSKTGMNPYAWKLAEWA